MDWRSYNDGAAVPPGAGPVDVGAADEREASAWAAAVALISWPDEAPMPLERALYVSISDWLLLLLVDMVLMLLMLLCLLGVKQRIIAGPGAGGGLKQMINVIQKERNCADAVSSHTGSCVKQKKGLRWFNLTSFPEHDKHLFTDASSKV